ncbi:MAG: cell division protein ZapA, partial [Chitinispirillaceae bacterium]|nr:cell division protein ZapA [Chitinispirillaceae bacterium]
MNNKRSESVRVIILGREYSIKSDVDALTTKVIAEYVDNKMKEIYKSSSMLDDNKIAVLTSLNIAGELFELQKKCTQQEKIIS